MRSPAERAPTERSRRGVEHALHAIGILAIAVLLWRSLRPPAASGDASSSSVGLEAALARWTLDAPSAVRVSFDAAPPPAHRDWLRALAKSGAAVRWQSTRAIAPAAIAVEPAAEPAAGTRVRVAAAGEVVSVADDAGTVDSLRGGGNAELGIGAAAGPVRARGVTFEAAAISPDSIVLRPVLVLGAAGWESKFTIAALEERGWQVASRVAVAPGIAVTQGPLGAVDTSRYSAVVVLDTTAGITTQAIARYARDGGGVVLSAAAAGHGPFVAIAPGAVGRRVAGVAGAVASDTPRSGLAVFTVASLRGDGVPLESRGRDVVVAARRVGAGRVVQAGYDETWRWRMSGGDGSVAAHREWWSRLVGAVAYAPLVPRVRAPVDDGDSAPLAALVHALGPPTPFDAPIARARDDERTTWILFALAVGALLAEWCSRRFRGAR